MGRVSVQAVLFFDYIPPVSNKFFVIYLIWIIYKCYFLSIHFIHSFIYFYFTKYWYFQRFMPIWIVKLGKFSSEIQEWLVGWLIGWLGF